MNLLDYDYEGLVRAFGTRFGKGEYHAGALFRSVYRKGAADPGVLPEFAANPSLAAAVREAFALALPEVSGKSGDGETYKFLLKLNEASGPGPGSQGAVSGGAPRVAAGRGALESESVVIPM